MLLIEGTTGLEKAQKNSRSKCWMRLVLVAQDSKDATLVAVPRLPAAVKLCSICLHVMKHRICLQARKGVSGGKEKSDESCWLASIPVWTG